MSLMKYEVQCKDDNDINEIITITCEQEKPDGFIYNEAKKQFDEILKERGIQNDAALYFTIISRSKESS